MQARAGRDEDLAGARAHGARRDRTLPARARRRGAARAHAPRVPLDWELLRTERGGLATQFGSFAIADDWRTLRTPLRGAEHRHRRRTSARGRAISGALEPGDRHDAPNPQPRAEAQYHERATGHVAQTTRRPANEREAFASCASIAARRALGRARAAAARRRGTPKHCQAGRARCSSTRGRIRAISTFAGEQLHAARPDSRARHDLVRRARVCHPRCRASAWCRSPPRSRSGAASNRRTRCGRRRSAVAAAVATDRRPARRSVHGPGAGRIRTSTSRDSRCRCSPRTGSRRWPRSSARCAQPRLDAAAIDAYRTGPGFARQTRGLGGPAFRPAVELSRMLATYPLAPPDPGLSVRRGSGPRRRVAQPAAGRASSSASAAASRASDVAARARIVDRRMAERRRQPGDDARGGRRHGERDAERACVRSTSPATRRGLPSAIPCRPIAPADEAAVAVMTDLLNIRLTIADPRDPRAGQRDATHVPATTRHDGLLHVRSGARPESIAPIIRFSTEELARIREPPVRRPPRSSSRSKAGMVLGKWQGSLDGARDASATYASETARFGSLDHLLKWPDAVRAVTAAGRERGGAEIRASRHAGHGRHRPDRRGAQGRAIRVGPLRWTKSCRARVDEGDHDRDDSFTLANGPAGPLTEYGRRIRSIGERARAGQARDRPGTFHPADRGGVK